MNYYGVKARNLQNCKIYIPDSSLDSGGFLGIGICSLVILSLALGIIITDKFGKKTSAYIRIFAITVLMIFLSVNSIVYFWIMDNMPNLYNLLGIMQFPWHFLDVWYMGLSYFLWQ